MEPSHSEVKPENTTNPAQVDKQEVIDDDELPVDDSIKQPNELEEQEFDIDKNIFTADYPNLKLAPVRIAIIGKSGTGKSSLINMLSNIFEGKMYEDQRTIAITQTTTITKKNNQVKTIALKSNIPEFNNKQTDNIGRHQGKSQTQKANPYYFRTPNCDITLIDTPGIGDTEGFEQDKKNIRSVVEALKQSEKFNCLCLVFKSSDQRIDASVQYLVAQYQSIMTKECQNNLIVCFTYVSDPYRIDTLQPLIEADIIKQNTPTFNFDNSCLVPLDIVCDDSKPKEKAAKKSVEGAKWISNYENAQKMILTASQMTEIEGQDILNLYLKRNLAYQESAKQIQIVKDIKKEEKILKSQLEDIESLVLKINNTNEHTSTKKIQKIVERTRKEMRNVKKSIAPEKSTICSKDDSVCHKNCSLEKIPEKGDASFLMCYAITGENCDVCKCHYKYHLHEDFVYVDEEVEVKYNDIVDSDEPYTDEILKKRNKEFKKLKEQKEAEKARAEKELDNLNKKKEASYGIIAVFHQEIQQETLHKKTNCMIIDYFKYKMQLVEADYQANVIDTKTMEEQLANYQKEIDTYELIEKPKKTSHANSRSKKKAEELLKEALVLFMKEMGKSACIAPNKKLVENLSKKKKSWYRRAVEFFYEYITTDHLGGPGVVKKFPLTYIPVCK